MNIHEETVELTKSLIKRASPYYHEQEVMSFALDWLKKQGFEAIHHHYKESKITGFEGENIICIAEGNKDGPTICLNGHLDTVPLTKGWTFDPYAGEIKAGKMYGLGALDMKSGCVAIMIAFRNFVRKYKDFKGKIMLSLVSDEEGPYGLGTNALIEEGYLNDIDCVLVAEPSAGFSTKGFPVLCLGAKGSVAYRVEFFGKAAHAAKPEAGISAAADAAKFLSRVSEQPEQIDKTKKGNIKKSKTNDVLGEGRICPLFIHADGGACSVPEYAEVVVQRHIINGETIDTVLAETKEILEQMKPASKYKISPRPAPSEGSKYYQPYVVAESDPYVVKMQESILQVCKKEADIDYMVSIGDFNYFATRLNQVSTLVIGPDGGNFHQSDEYVQVDTIGKTAEIVEVFLEKTLAGL